jgi:hypothetical protein
MRVKNKPLVRLSKLVVANLVRNQLLLNKLKLV